MIITREALSEVYGDDDLLFLDGREYDEAILGVCTQYGRPPVVAYDYAKVIAILQAHGMDYSEAVEFHEFNQVAAWVGDRTPVFVQALGSIF